MATAIATDDKSKQTEKSPKKTEKLLAEGFTVKARMKNAEVSNKTLDKHKEVKRE